MKRKFSLIRILLPIIIFGIAILTSLFDFAFKEMDIIQKDIEINQYIAEITINESGDMAVVETWDMTYNGDYNVRFRDIDYDKFPRDYPLYNSSTNVSFFDTDSVSVQVKKNGVNITNDITIGYSFNGDYDELFTPVDCDPIRTNCESIFTNFMWAGGLDENIEFTYTYTILGAVTEYSNISELNWVLFEYAESSVDDGKIIIHLPDNSNSTADYYVFSHDIDNTITTIHTNDHIVISFENMSKKDILGFRLLVPTETFSDIESRNIVINHQIDKQVILDYEEELQAYYDTGEILEDLFMYIPYGVALVMLLISFGLYSKFFKPFKTNFEDEIYREFPSNHSPAVIGYLYRNKKFRGEDITATVLDLVRREYLSLDDSLAFESPEDFALIIVKNESADMDLLLPHERHLIEWLVSDIGDGKVVTTKEIEDYGKDRLLALKFSSQANTFVEKVKHEANKYDFFDKKLGDSKKIAFLFLIIPVSLLFSSLFLNGFYSINLTISYIVSIVMIITFIVFIVVQKRRSENGQELYNKWKAYNNYLLDKEELKSYGMSSVEFWEHSIIYATTFGIADKVMEQLTIKMPMDEAIASESRYLGVGYRHKQYRYGHFIHTMNHSYTSASHNSFRYSTSSSGGSSGFSGGSFGGGGGGGRSR